MNNYEIEEYEEYCKEFIESNLPDYEGSGLYICDLANYVTEGINANGTATFSTLQAKEYIKEWWEEAEEIFQYYQNELGMSVNPFENPERFHVLMIIYGVERLINQCEFVQTHWDEEMEITEEIINNIINELDNYSIDF